jgi:7-carboxy-7-deazaguanine synthase
MSKIKISEAFYSIQGEGLWTGVPSVFLRTFGCNFTCSGFGLPKGEQSTERDTIAFGHKNTPYKSYEDLPLAKTGCDSYAAWDVRFKDLSPMLTVDAIVDRLLQLIPNNTWTQPNGQDIHLVITGGEPLLGWQRSYISLLDHPKMQDLKNLTFETNATQKLYQGFSDYVKLRNKKLHITWSCSPKLTVSGESWEEAIRPDIVQSYYDLYCSGGSSLYLKFVVANHDDILDVNRAVEAYRKAGVHCPVYLMPVGGTVESYMMNNRQVAEYAMSQGWRYSPRLQVDLFGNAWGT